MYGHAVDDCQALFEQSDMSGADLRSGIVGYRTRTVTAGAYKYVSCYPIWATRSEARKAREKIDEIRSKPAQVRINWKNAQLKFEQLVNANFGAGDLFVTLTYSSAEQPTDEAQAKADLRNYLARVRYLRARRGLDPLRFVCVMEKTSTGKYHFHMIMGSGLDRDEVERLWRRGFVNSRRCQTEEAGLAGLANYMTKLKPGQTKGWRKWTCSRNLIRPTATVADHKFTRRRVERIAEAMQAEGRQIFEKQFSGWQVIDDIVMRASDFVAGAYIYARLRKARRRE